jgi:hypothetical protein
MLESRLTKQALLLLVMIGLFFHISETLHLYIYYWWVDKVLHLASGALVAMTVLIFWNYFYPKYKLGKVKTITLAILGAIFIGVLWEVFEVKYGITFLSDGIVYIRDTSSDILMDIIGGFFGSLYAYNSIRKQ